MKKIIAITIGIFALYSCETHTYEDLQNEPVVEGDITYTTHIQPLVAANCVNCHSTEGSASFRPLGSYAELKDAVLTTNLLERIHSQNGEPILMPPTGRMPQVNIDLITEWNAAGMPE